jgi:hypothetical protein
MYCPCTNTTSSVVTFVVPEAGGPATLLTVTPMFWVTSAGMSLTAAVVGSTAEMVNSNAFTADVAEAVPINSCSGDVTETAYTLVRPEAAKRAPRAGSVFKTYPAVPLVK